MPSNARALHSVPDPDDRPSDDNGARMEMVVLGKAMGSVEEYESICVVGLDRTWFADHRHGDIWDVIREAYGEGEPAGPVAVTERMIKSREITKHPHPAYLFDIHRAAAEAGTGEWYARQMGERFQRRTVMIATSQLGQAVASPMSDLGRITELAAQVVEAATPRTVGVPEVTLIGDLFDEYVRTYFNENDTEIIPSPWSDLNKLLTSGGFTPGQMVTVGGATGSGKSIALTNMAQEIGIRQRKHAVMFTMEMRAEDVMMRIASSMSAIPESKIKDRSLDERELVNLDHTRQRLRDAPLRVIDGRKTVTQMRASVAEIEREFGKIDAVLVDYIQLVLPPGRTENRQIEVAQIMKELKDWAIKENVLVVGAAQTNRGPGQRADKRPELSDLRESGEIENSSDIVILLYRDEYYNKDSVRQGEADFELAKQRSGPSGKMLVLAAQLHLTRFMSMAMPS